MSIPEKYNLRRVCEFKGDSKILLDLSGSEDDSKSLNSSTSGNRSELDIKKNEYIPPPQAPKFTKSQILRHFEIPKRNKLIASTPNFNRLRKRKSNSVTSETSIDSIAISPISKQNNEENYLEKIVTENKRSFSKEKEVQLKFDDHVTEKNNPVVLEIFEVIKGKERLSEFDIKHKSDVFEKERCDNLENTKNKTKNCKVKVADNNENSMKNISKSQLPVVKLVHLPILSANNAVTKCVQVSGNFEPIENIMEEHQLQYSEVNDVIAIDESVSKKLSFENSVAIVENNEKEERQSKEGSLKNNENNACTKNTINLLENGYNEEISHDSCHKERGISKQDENKTTRQDKTPEKEENKTPEKEESKTLRHEENTTPKLELTKSKEIIKSIWKNFEEDKEVQAENKRKKIDQVISRIVDQQHKPLKLVNKLNENRNNENYSEKLTNISETHHEVQLHQSTNKPEKNDLNCETIISPKTHINRLQQQLLEIFSKKNEASKNPDLNIQKRIEDITGTQLKECEDANESKSPNEFDQIHILTESQDVRNDEYCNQKNKNNNIDENTLHYRSKNTNKNLKKSNSNIISPKKLRSTNRSGISCNKNLPLNDTNTSSHDDSIVRNSDVKTNRDGRTSNSGKSFRPTRLFSEKKSVIVSPTKDEIISRKTKSSVKTTPTDDKIITRKSKSFLKTMPKNKTITKTTRSSIKHATTDKITRKKRKSSDETSPENKTIVPKNKTIVNEIKSSVRKSQTVYSNEKRKEIKVITYKKSKRNKTTVSSPTTEKENKKEKRESKVKITRQSRSSVSCVSTKNISTKYFYAEKDTDRTTTSRKATQNVTVNEDTETTLRKSSRIRKSPTKMRMELCFLASKNNVEKIISNSLVKQTNDVFKLPNSLPPRRKRSTKKVSKEIQKTLPDSGYVNSSSSDNVNTQSFINDKKQSTYLSNDDPSLPPIAEEKNMENMHEEENVEKTLTKKKLSNNDAKVNCQTENSELMNTETLESSVRRLTRSQKNRTTMITEKSLKRNTLEKSGTKKPPQKSERSGRKRQKITDDCSSTSKIAKMDLDRVDENENNKNIVIHNNYLLNEPLQNTMNDISDRENKTEENRVGNKNCDDDFDCVPSNSNDQENNQFEYISYVANNCAQRIRWNSKNPELVSLPGQRGLKIGYTVTKMNLGYCTFSMGILQIDGGCFKSSCHFKRSYMFYRVLEGEVEAELNHSRKIYNEQEAFFVPLGTDYSLVNPSTSERVLLFFVKVNSPLNTT